MMKKIAVVVMILCVISSHLESGEADATDCNDACSTGCVQQNSRLQSRCERKCQIKCGPDLKLEEHLD